MGDEGQEGKVAHGTMQQNEEGAGRSRRHTYLIQLHAQIVRHIFRRLVVVVLVVPVWGRCVV